MSSCSRIALIGKGRQGVFHCWTRCAQHGSRLSASVFSLSPGFRKVRRMRGDLTPPLGSDRAAPSARKRP